MGDVAIDFVGSLADRDVSNQSANHRVGRLAFGLRRVGGDQAMTEHGMGHGANVFDRHARPAVERRARLGGQDERLAGTRPRAQAIHLLI